MNPSEAYEAYMLTQTTSPSKSTDSLPREAPGISLVRFASSCDSDDIF